MSDTRTHGDPSPKDPSRPPTTRQLTPAEAETKARLEGVDPARRFPNVPGVVLTGELGRGGMGVVYCGRQEKLGRTVAVKTLGTDYRGGAIERRFLNEGKNQARLDHPNVVICHDSGTTREGEPYLVLEYVGGPNLLEWIREHGPLQLIDALHFALALTRALEHGLEKNLVHRDVKAENVLLKPDTRARSKSFPFVPKLADFGLSRTDEGQGAARLTQQGEAWGSPQTMAPEQFDGFADVDHRADMYALGCVLYYVLTGKQAFRETTIAALRKHKRDGPVPDPREVVPDIHAGTAELIVALLAIDPEGRPLDYAALEQRLVAIIEELQPAARLEEARRKRVLLRVVLPLAVVAVSATTWAIVRGRGTVAPAPNAAPILTALRGPGRVDAGTQNLVTAEATDPEGGELTWEWTLEGPFWWKVPASGPTPSSRLLNCPEAPEAGDYEIVARVRAVDAEGLASAPKELKLSVTAGAEGLPLKAPVVLTPEDDESLRKLWNIEGDAFEVGDLGVLGRSVNEREMSRTLPRGTFALTGRILVQRGTAQVRAVLSLILERAGGRTHSIQIYPKEGSALVVIETSNFDRDARTTIPEEEAIDLRVEWDGTKLAVRARSESQPAKPLLDVIAADAGRPESLRVKVLGGDFFLQDVQIAPLAPK